MLKKVLVAIDVAREAGNDTIMEMAQKLAHTIDGELILLHVIEPIPRRVLLELPKEALARRKSHADEEMEKLSKQYDCADGIVREGPPSNEILNYAAEIGSDLIVLHSHDPELSDYFIGSVASRVVRRAHCSVYIVREAGDDT
jgi:universal stress protein F